MAEVLTPIAETQADPRVAALGRVAVLDAGGQYVDMVQKAVERQGLPADVLPLGTPVEKLEGIYGAVIISGSPASSNETDAPMPDARLWESKLPVLGICYGMQAMAVAHGGKVSRNGVREDGRVTTEVETKHPLFAGSKKAFTALFTHGDFVTTVPKGFEAIGKHTLDDGTTAYSAIADGNKAGVQFHPEVFDDTPGGHQLFGNFLHGIAGLAVDPSFQERHMAELIETKRQEIARQVGDRHVIAFISGGVDSSVAAMLAARVISPEKFHGYYIDNGFMRDEDAAVIEALTAAGIAVTQLDTAEQFEQGTVTIDGTKIGPLVTVTDPESKRKIIGKTFIDVQNDIIAQLNLGEDEAVLLQGTNAADRIESGHSAGGNTDTIKTHHNQVKEVRELKERGLVVEPLDDLFKDEIRALGASLGLPHELVQRHPFPGPGLAIRILAAAEAQARVTPPEFQEDIQAFVDTRLGGEHAVTVSVLPVKSVGVGGDERTHLSAVAVQSRELTRPDLEMLARDIPAAFGKQVNRVVWALGEQPLDAASVTPTLLTADVRGQLRRADQIVFEVMREYEVLDEVKQLPVILLPVSFGKPGERSIVLRPVTTSTFMTVQAMLPERDLPLAFFSAVTQRILREVPGISQVFLDLTNKPPGTTEWE